MVYGSVGKLRKIHIYVKAVLFPMSPEYNYKEFLQSMQIQIKYDE